MNACQYAINVWLEEEHHLDDFREREFEGSWGSDFMEPGTRKLVVSQIDDGNGYDVADIAAIFNLEVGQTWQSNNHASHTITRTK